MAKIIVTRDAKVLQEVELNKERVTIGRHPHNDVVIEHAAISGYHAAITTILKDAFLEDLGSTNGTFVNSMRITKHVLQDRDQITLAMYQLEFVVGARERSAHQPLPRLPAVSSGPGVNTLSALPLGDIEVINGTAAGKKLALTKPVTTLGRPGISVVVIARRPDGYFIAHIDGETVPTLNGEALSIQPTMLQHGDMIDLEGTQMAFSLPI